jgi:hypothetical protein
MYSRDEWERIKQLLEYVKQRNQSDPWFAAHVWPKIQQGIAAQTLSYTDLYQLYQNNAIDSRTQATDDQMQKPDLGKMYNKYNSAYFQGSLPALTPMFASLPSGYGADTIWSYDRESKKLIPGTLRMKISEGYDPTSSQYASYETSLKGTLLHEMVHVWQATHGDAKGGHDHIFMKKLHEIASAAQMDFEDLLGARQPDMADADM